MTAEQRAKVLAQARAEVHRSAILAHVTNRAFANAAAIRHTAAQQRRQAFVLYIGGGGGTDAVDEGAIRKKLARGTLPRFPAAKIQYTRGERKACVACDMPIARHHVEVDADFDLVLAGMRVTLPFHAACFIAWQKETHTSVA